MSQLIGDLFTSDKIDLDYMADEGNQFTRFQKNYITENLSVKNWTKNHNFLCQVPSDKTDSSKHWHGRHLSLQGDQTDSKQTKRGGKPFCHHLYPLTSGLEPCIRSGRQGSHVGLLTGHREQLLPAKAAWLQGFLASKGFSRWKQVNPSRWMWPASSPGCSLCPASSSPGGVLTCLPIRWPPLSTPAAPVMRSPFIRWVQKTSLLHASCPCSFVTQDLEVLC